jgi:hypothetical protein
MRGYAAPCVRCHRRRWTKTDGSAVGYPGPMCDPCYQMEWKKQRHPGRCQAAEQKVAILEKALRYYAYDIRDQVLGVKAREALYDCAAIDARTRRPAVDRRAA